MDEKKADEKKVTVRKMGGSLGVTLPKDFAKRMQVREGDTLYAVETDQGILLTPLDPTFEKAMRIYERGARKYRNALRELAK